MNNKFKTLYQALIDYGYKDVTDSIDLEKGKRKLKRKTSTILFEYEDAYFIDVNSKMERL